MDAPSRYHRVIAGDGGAVFAPVRGVLRAASAVYGAGVAIRNRRYERDPAAMVRMPVPVISVGNITAGGTGKTPLVIHVARRLLDAGWAPAVVSRGYKGSRGREADEVLLFRRLLAGVPCVADPDRVAGAQAAIGQHLADAIILDDAFQHRRIARDLDVVMIDATCPFGFGRLLPRGLLREPLRELRRATLLVLSHADQVDADSLASIESELQVYAPDVPSTRTRHRPSMVVKLTGAPANIEPAALGPVYCFAAIGNPGAFHHTVRSIGIDVKGARWWPDHHRYTVHDLASMQRAARDARAVTLITTEKDAVKLGGLSGRGALPILALRMEIDFLGDGDTILASALERSVGQRRGPHDGEQIHTD